MTREYETIYKACIHSRPLFIASSCARLCESILGLESALQRPASGALLLNILVDTPTQHCERL